MKKHIHNWIKRGRERVHSSTVKFIKRTLSAVWIEAWCMHAATQHIINWQGCKCVRVWMHFFLSFIFSLSPFGICTKTHTHTQLLNCIKWFIELEWKMAKMQRMGMTHKTKGHTAQTRTHSPIKLKSQDLLQDGKCFVCYRKSKINSHILYEHKLQSWCLHFRSLIHIILAAVQYV